jgi:hypothetical protein
MKIKFSLIKKVRKVLRCIIMAFALEPAITKFAFKDFAINEGNLN